MKCLYCELWEVYPEEPAGLCASCRGSVRYGLLIPEPDPQTNYTTLLLVTPPISPRSPLGHELGEEWIVAKAYLPELHLTGYAESDRLSVASQYREELMRLHSGFLEARSESKKLPERAKRLLAGLRAVGVNAWVHTGRGHAVLDRPKAVPYAMLLEWIELQAWVEDELTTERARELETIGERYRYLAGRFGNDLASEETGYTEPIPDTEGEAISEPDANPRGSTDHDTATARNMPTL